jgi:hypothetical protein
VLPVSEQAAFVLREIIHYSPAISAQGLNTSTANSNRLLERAQDRTVSDTDTPLPFLQHCHQEKISRTTVNMPETSSFSQASEPNDIAACSAGAGIHSSTDQSLSFDKTVFDPKPQSGKLT